MRKAIVYLNLDAVGTLTETSQGYVFQYDERYIAQPNARALSLTLPISSQAFSSTHLFSFFYGLLSEGYNRALQCRLLKIDENDDFGLLLAIAHTDTIGAVRIVAQTQNPKPENYFSMGGECPLFWDSNIKTLEGLPFRLLGKRSDSYRFRECKKNMGWYSMVLH